jgi:type II secretory pathway component PulM
MKARMEALRAAWLLRAPRERSILKALAAALGVLVLALIWSSVQSERARLQKAVPLAQARLQRMQDDAAEVVRLRGQSSAPAAAPTSLADAVAASAHGRQLDLAVTGEGADRIQVHGSAAFDDAVAWLATVQQDFKLRVATLTATRNGAAVRLDAVLVAPTP